MANYSGYCLNRLARVMSASAMRLLKLAAAALTALSVASQ